MKYGTCSLIILLLLSTGCTSYPPASITDGVIHNPNVGWNGYSIRIPAGVQLFPDSADENVPDREAEVRAWYTSANERYTADYYASYQEQFLFEDAEQTWFLSFITETYALPAGWTLLTSGEKQYIIQKMINRKKVIINDMDAHSEQIEMNGQRGWYISGGAKPYFKRAAETVPYEGIFLIGNLKEVFWIEAFGPERTLSAMRAAVFEMARSLDVH